MTSKVTREGVCLYSFLRKGLSHTLWFRCALCQVSKFFQRGCSLEGYVFSRVCGFSRFRPYFAVKAACRPARLGSSGPNFASLVSFAFRPASLLVILFPPNLPRSTAVQNNRSIAVSLGSNSGLHSDGYTVRVPGAFRHIFGGEIGRSEGRRLSAGYARKIQKHRILTAELNIYLRIVRNSGKLGR